MPAHDHLQVDRVFADLFAAPADAGLLRAAVEQAGRKRVKQEPTSAGRWASEPPVIAPTRWPIPKVIAMAAALRIQSGVEAPHREYAFDVRPRWALGAAA